MSELEKLPYTVYRCVCLGVWEWGEELVDHVTSVS